MMKGNSIYRCCLALTAIFLTFLIISIFFYRILTVLLLLPYQNKTPIFQDSSLTFIGKEWRVSAVKDIYGKCAALWDATNETTIIETIAKLQMIGDGWNKMVYQQGNYALKIVNLKGEALQACIKSTSQVENCLNYAVNAFVKEIITLINLQNDTNVPKLFAYCIPQNTAYNIERLAMLVEKGKQLDMIYLLQKDWYERLRIFAEIIQLLERVHPYVFNDIRRQQFVVINEHPYIADLDDVVVANETFENNTHSAMQSYKSFVRTLLLYDNPKTAEEHLDALEHSYENNTLTMGFLKTKISFLKTL